MPNSLVFFKHPKINTATTFKHYLPGFPPLTMSFVGIPIRFFTRHWKPKFGSLSRVQNQSGHHHFPQFQIQYLDNRMFS